MAQAIEFIFAGVDPKGAFTALAEFDVFGKLPGVGVERISMEGEVVEKRGGLVNGRGTSGGGSRDVVLRVAVEAAVVAATVVAAGDGGGRDAD